MSGKSCTYYHNLVYYVVNYKELGNNNLPVGGDGGGTCTFVELTVNTYLTLGCSVSSNILL